MRKLTVLFVILLAPPLAPARDKPEAWTEVRSPHFTVLTTSNEKDGRRIADQFERMRSISHMAFPHLPIDNGSPIVVIALKDEKDFRTLEPEAYLAKGQLKLGGLFLRAPDKNYVLMRLDAESDHPYAVIYHEYMHFLLSKAAEWMPLWMNEGLAEFYENTDIHEKNVALGQPSEANLLLLRQNKLLPLPVLFTVDATSPYYHEENKGSIFYAESWALPHYLYTKDRQQKTQLWGDYIELLVNKVDPVTAATRAFGDLKQLQSNLEAYVRQGRFQYFKLAAATGIDDATFTARTLTEAQADAVRADFLAYNERFTDARLLLDRVLREDPQNVLAHETMGFLEFRAGHLEESRKWYEQAVKLDSQSYLAHYYFAAISMNSAGEPNSETDAQVEASLRAAIKLNPSFAPPYERLAAFEGMRRRNLDEAHLMSLKAVELDPANVPYRISAAHVLMQMERLKDAEAVLHEASRIAKTPEETASVQDFLRQVEDYATARDRVAEQNRRMATEGNEPDDKNETIEPETPEEKPPAGTHRFLAGKFQDVRCRGSAIDLILVAKGKTMALHSGNYYKLAFTALGFSPKSDINPCHDLEGASAKIEYVDSPTLGKPAYVFAIELHQ